jgi:hypothetical protein
MGFGPSSLVYVDSSQMWGYLLIPPDSHRN